MSSDPRRAPARRSVALGALALIAPVAFIPLLMNPRLAIGAAAAAAFTFLLWCSPAVALGLAHAGDLAPIAGGEAATGSVTIELLALLLAGSAFAIIRRPRELPDRLLFYAPLLFSFALLAVMVVRLADSPGGEYGSRKVQFFLIVNIALLAAGIVVGTRRRDVELSLALMAGVAAIAALVVAGQIMGGVQPNFEGRYAISNEHYDPIALGRLAGSGLLITLFMVVATRSRYRLVALGALPFITIALLASGGRGAVLGVVAGLAVLLGVPAILTVRRWKILTGILVSGILATLFVPGAALDRAVSVLSGSSQGRDSGGRTDLWSQAWNAFANHPVDGIGTGGFISLNPAERYPHNFVLEVAAELGALGLVPLLLALGTGVFVLVSSMRRAAPGERGLLTLIAALLACAFVNATLSTDITADYDVWLFLGLGAGLAWRFRIPAPHSAV